MEVLRYCIVFLAGFFIGLSILILWSPDTVLCSDESPCELKYINGKWVIEK